MNENKRKNDQRGVLLSEVLLVVFIISIIALIVIPRYFSTKDKARYESCRTNVANIDALVQQYYIREGTWPQSDLADIGANINYFPEGVLPSCPVTSGAQYIIVSPSHRVGGHARNDPTHP
jgi:general secretion pathway protein G